MSKTPFFSIIIPTYNRANFIDKTIKSVLEQTFTNFEVLVIDDGSNDKTKEVINTFYDSRITYIYQINQERGAARNNGIRNSKGEYITFLDSDDLYQPFHLEVVYNNLFNLKLPNFFHQSYWIEDTEGRVIKKFQNKCKNPLKKLIKKGNFFGSVGLFIKNTISQKYLFEENRIIAGSEDYDFLLRICTREKINIDDVPTTRVINHEDRGEFKINKQKLISRVEFLLEKTLNDKDFVNKYKKWLPAFKFSNYSFVALHLANHKEKKEAFRYLKKALCVSTSSILSKRSFIVIYCILFR